MKPRAISSSFVLSIAALCWVSREVTSIYGQTLTWREGNSKSGSLGTASPYSFQEVSQVARLGSDRYLFPTRSLNLSDGTSSLNIPGSHHQQLRVDFPPSIILRSRGFLDRIALEWRGLARATNALILVGPGCSYSALSTSG
jgi:hypothetical protein